MFKVSLHQAIFTPNLEHRVSIMDLHLTLFLAVLFASTQVILFFASSSCTLRLQDCRGRPLLLNPWGFHSRAEQVMLFSGSRSVCLIHFHFLLLMLSSMRLCCVLPYSSSFEMTCGQRMFKIFLKHLLINVCNFLICSFVDLQVSEPHRRADFMFILFAV